MLDINLFRNELSAVVAGLAKRGVTVNALAYALPPTDQVRERFELANQP